ncbi:GNAT family N-acetyltransferase [Novosphingobium sp. FSY-8]|uniref:GNAT family N-acetyltransferase n=1 Tax=Novosphingobium ovatum TaxID=1908523 RepID=A0ABW9XGC9_9SPHN|nr:GNAT family N-acetyltransferase [Novosphingobium ovatum]NBC37538.1 GNAT family N-acetyltransferase [Novosphingobium ovatum]
MQRAWHQLEVAAFLPTQSRLFTQALARTMLRDVPMHVVMVRRPGGVGGVLPLCRARGWFARWRMAGAREVFEPGDALYDSPQSARMLARAVARQRRPVALDRVPANSLLPDALRAEMKGRGLVLQRPATGCPTIALDDSWRDPESHFNPGRRSDFRRAARRAQALGRVFYEVIAPDPAEFDTLFDEAIAVERAGWKETAGTAIAADPAKEAFFRAYFRDCCNEGTLRIAFMRIDNRPVAVQLALEMADRFWLFKIGFDENYAKCSPGTLLMLHTLRYAAQANLAAYELMGGMEPWIAAFWTREHHECLRLRTYPWGLRGTVALALDGAAWARERLRQRWIGRQARGA